MWTQKNQVAQKKRLLHNTIIRVQLNPGNKGAACGVQKRQKRRVEGKVQKQDCIKTVCSVSENQRTKVICFHDHSVVTILCHNHCFNKG